MSKEYKNKNNEYQDAKQQMKERHKDELNCLEMGYRQKLLKIAIKDETAKERQDIELGWLRDCVNRLAKIELQEQNYYRIKNELQ